MSKINVGPIIGILSNKFDAISYNAWYGRQLVDPITGILSNKYIMLLVGGTLVVVEYV